MSNDSGVKTCSHCSGQGDTMSACCARKAGVKHNAWFPGRAVCCACGGSGVKRV
ncbi:MAG: hypothetical protein ABH864_06505 [archaeon]